MSAYYMNMIDDADAWPDNWSQRTLIRTTRRALSLLREEPERLELVREPDDPYERIIWSFVRDGDLALEVDPLAERRVMIRAELGQILSLSNATQQDRRIQAIQFILKHMEYFSGWEHMQTNSELYQLQESKPWWHPSGAFFQREEQRLSLKTAEQLHEKGFVCLMREAYIERVREPIIFSLLHRGHSLERLAAILALYTANARELREPRRWIERMLEDLRRDCSRELQRRDFTAVPMKPLYSLPREANNLRSFFISRAAELKVDQATGVIKSKLPRARVRVVDDSHGQQTLFFDTDLVLRQSGELDSFVSIQLNEAQTDVLGALTKAIEQLDVDPAVFEHVPRVCAGLFAAAHRDRHTAFGAPGTFWDTDSGKRLCRIVGFNPDNYKHRQRVQDVRKLLSELKLHRAASGFDDRGNKIRIKYKGPLIELRQAQLELEIEDREGISERHTFQAWSIDDTLWKMTLYEEDGGAPAFMLLDDRAFKLDDRSSVAFNLYWTLVNRAYNDRVNESGMFRLKLWTLYNWSGLESSTQRVDRLKETFRAAFDRMVEVGLLQDWKCASLGDSKRTTMRELEEAELWVTFGQEQRKTLPKHRPVAALV